MQWLVENGVVATSSAILLAITSNLLLALILFGVIRRKTRYLQFPATLRKSLQCPSGVHIKPKNRKWDKVFHPTNKDRLCEQSEPQSYPVVGRARQ